jgi:hypothetical protein
MPRPIIRAEHSLVMFNANREPVDIGESFHGSM